MTIKRFFSCRRLACGAGVMILLLLSGPPPLVLAQTAPAGEVPQQTEQRADKAAPPKGTATDMAQPPSEQGSAYRKQKDNLKPFEPSEEIRVDKAVDFPADI